MLKALAEFSKKVSKYAYYPMLIFFVAVVSAYIYNGQGTAVIAIIIAVICAVLCVVALLKNWLCRKAGIDDKVI